MLPHLPSHKSPHPPSHLEPGVHGVCPRVWKDVHEALPVIPTGGLAEVAPLELVCLEPVVKRKREKRGG